MKVIWKYEFAIDDLVEVKMPHGMKVLSVGLQKKHHICVWAEVDPDAEKVPYLFAVRGTGHSIPDQGDRFLGTVFDGPFVWHVFGPWRP